MEVDVEPSGFYDDFSTLIEPNIGNNCSLVDLEEMLISCQQDFLPTLSDQSQSDNSDSGTYSFENIPNVPINSECDSPVNEFNPDDFLNYFPELNVKTYESERETPSPTSSSVSSSFSETSSSEFFKQGESISSSKTAQNKKFTISNSSNTPTIISSQPVSVKSATQMQINQNKVHVKDEPITFTTISETNSTNGFVGNLAQVKTYKLKTNEDDNKKSKTLLLSANDFKNLVERCKNQNKGNMPKIVFKTNENGQNVFINSRRPSNSSIQSSNGIPLPRISTPNIYLSKVSPHLLETHKTMPKLLPASAAAIRSSPSTRAIVLPTLVNQTFDEKLLKKRERMIKNRKSATLSRMKKKDYMSSLENKVKGLEMENNNLKNENISLRNQLDAATKQCQCNKNKRKFSDIITLTPISNLSFKPISNNSSLNKIFVNSSALRKNTAVLLAMVFMISLNFGTIHNFLTPPNISLSDDDSSGLKIPLNSPFADLSSDHIGRRSLLWVDDNSTIDRNISKRQVYRSIKNNSIENIANCPLYINQTENLRLAAELRKWIGVNDYLNISSILKTNSQKDRSKFDSEYFQRNEEVKNLLKDLKTWDSYIKKNRKNYFSRNVLRKNRKNAADIHKKKYKSENHIQIFKPNTNEKYSKLFEKIKRRDDTFYVVSFNTEHILLPASAYNKSSRPKMSLMLPASDTLLDGKITLMQIDCEVINTTMIELNEELIPQNLRPTQTKFNVSSKTDSLPVDNNATQTVENGNNFEMKTKMFDNIYPAARTMGPARKGKHEIDDPFMDVLKNNSKTDKKSKVYKPYFINDDEGK